MVTYEFTHPKIAGTLYIADPITQGRYTVVSTNPHHFVNDTLHLLTHGAHYYIKEQHNAVLPVEQVLTLFCMHVFSAGGNGVTSCWKHIESGDTYLVVYDYDSEDYYQTAWSYCVKMSPFF